MENVQVPRMLNYKWVRGAGANIFDLSHVIELQPNAINPEIQDIVFGSNCSIPLDCMREDYFALEVARDAHNSAPIICNMRIEGQNFIVGKNMVGEFNSKLYVVFQMVSLLTEDTDIMHSGVLHTLNGPCGVIVDRQDGLEPRFELLIPPRTIIGHLVYPLHEGLCSAPRLGSLVTLSTDPNDMVAQLDDHIQIRMKNNMLLVTSSFFKTNKSAFKSRLYSGFYGVVDSGVYVRDLGLPQMSQIVLLVNLNSAGRRALQIWADAPILVPLNDPDHSVAYIGRCMDDGDSEMNVIGRVNTYNPNIALCAHAVFVGAPLENLLAPASLGRK